MSIRRSFRKGNVIPVAEDASPEATSIEKCMPKDAEATSVLVGSLEFLTKPIMAFVRLTEGRNLGSVTEVSLPVRFVFVCLGPERVSLDYYEIGRAISTLMADNVRYLAKLF